MTSEDVINRLADLLTIYGVPEHIRSDNGPEFIAKAIQQWLALLSVQTLYFEPGRTAAPKASTAASGTSC